MTCNYIKLKLQEQICIYFSIPYSLIMQHEKEIELLYYKSNRYEEEFSSDNDCEPACFNMQRESKQKY